VCSFVRVEDVGEGGEGSNNAGDDSERERVLFDWNAGGKPTEQETKGAFYSVSAPCFMWTILAFVDLPFVLPFQPSHTSVFFFFFFFT